MTFKEHLFKLAQLGVVALTGMTVSVDTTHADLIRIESPNGIVENQNVVILDGNDYQLDDLVFVEVEDVPVVITSDLNVQGLGVFTDDRIYVNAPISSVIEVTLNAGRFIAFNNEGSDLSGMEGAFVLRSLDEGDSLITFENRELLFESMREWLSVDGLEALDALASQTTDFEGFSISHDLNANNPITSVWQVGSDTFEINGQVGPGVDVPPLHGSIPEPLSSTLLIGAGLTLLALQHGRPSRSR